MSLAADIARVKAWLRLPLLAFALVFAAAAGAGPASSFDHFTTSFELLGQHKDVACEACHVGGIFKGTPHECVSCHMTGSRIGATAKPTNGRGTPRGQGAKQSWPDAPGKARPRRGQRQDAAGPEEQRARQPRKGRGRGGA